MPKPQALGPLHSVMMPELLADAAKEAALHPSTFIGILCLPNTSAYGKSSAKKHMQEAKDDILNKLQEPCNNFEVELVTLQWDSSTMYSDIRPGKADWVVFISSIRDGSGKPVSEFHSCKPMVRTCLPGLVPVFQRANFRNWLVQSGSASSELLHEPVELRQWNTGVSQWTAWLEAVLQGRGVSRSAQIRDWCPCDNTLGKTCMLLNAKQPRTLPRLAYTGTAWLNLIHQHGGMFLAENIKLALVCDLRQLLLTRAYRFPGLYVPDTPAAAQGARPRMPDHFKLTQPRGETELPIRQTVLDQWAKDMPLQQDHLKKIIQAHDCAVNKSGVPHRTQSRPSPVSLADLPGAKAIRLDMIPGQATSMEELVDKCGPIVEVITGEYKLLACKQGSLYVVGLADCVLRVEKPLFIVKGKFWMDNKAKEMISGGPCISHQFTGDSLIISDDNNNSKVAPTLGDMPATTQTLQNYLGELAKRGHVLTKMLQHTIARQSGSAASYTVTATGPTALEPSLPKNTKKETRPTVGNFSQWVSVPGILSSTRLQVVHRLTFNPNTGFIDTGYPGVHTKDEVELKAGELLCLAWVAS
jgi:hypothetical protein